MSDLTLHKVLDGPIDHDTTTGDTLWSVVYLAEDPEGQIGHHELYYDNLDDAYDHIKTVNSTIEGLKLEIHDV